MEEQNKKSVNHLEELELQWEMDRLSRLMESFRKPLEKIDPKPKPQEINALYGEGFKVKGEPVICIIYVFERQELHIEAQDVIKKYQNAKSTEVITSSNGRLFFWGFLLEDNPNAIYTLNDLASTFAGEE